MTDQRAEITTVTARRIEGILVKFGPITFLIAITVIVNVMWVRTNRAGFPFDIDEAGYLQRALKDSWQLSNNGFAAFVGQLRGPDPQAPLLPASAALLRSASSTGLTGMMLIQQFWYALLVVSTWLAGLRITNRRAAFAAAVIVATTPAAFVSSRSFQFALVAAATVTAVLAAQIWADSFDRLGRAIIWGALLGVATLSRTMFLGLLPGLLIAAVVRVLASGQTRVRLRNLAAGIAVGTLVAWSWYSASWRNVLDYLTTYGYGSKASDYGDSSSILSSTWWTRRPIHVVQDALWAPTTILLFILLLIALYAFGTQELQKRRGTKVREAPQRDSSRTLSPISQRIRSGALHPLTTPTLFVLWSYLALSSTRNSGSWFELPVLPALILVIVAAACRVRWATWATVSLSLSVGTLVFIADSSSRFTPPATLTIGPISSVIFDSRGSLLTYADAFGAAQTSTDRTSADEGLRAQAAASRAVADAVLETAAEHGRQPVVFFATQDPFVNTNTVALDVFIASERPLPIGLLLDEQASGVPLALRLSQPNYGIPNIVIIGPNSTNFGAAAFSPLSDPMRTIPELQAAGFTRARQVPLPDGRELEIWWRDSGPTVEVE